MKLNEISSLDIRSLRILMSVATTGNFTAAATSLGITQSAVSQTISNIEKIVGAQLVDRNKRPLRLTPAGVSLNRSASQIVADMDRLIAQTREAARLSKTEVRLGMIDSFSATVGPLILKDLVKGANHIRAWSGLAHSHSTGLLNRQLEIVITTDQIDDVDGLVRLPLYKEPFLMAIPIEHKKQFENLDLNGCIQALPFIRFSARSHFGDKIERHLRRSSVIVPNFIEIDTADVVLSMIANGLGWAITSPLCILQGEAYLDKLALLPLPGRALSRMIYLIHRQGENEDVADHIFTCSKTALDNHVLPKIHKYIPWVEIPRVT